MTYSKDAAIKVASGEIGYRESGTNNTKYNHWLGKIGGYPHGGYGYPWCASFEGWVADQGGGRANVDYPRTAGCAVAVGWFKSNGRWSSSPHVGDWVFYGPGGSTHVELVVKVSGSRITTIGGNTSGSLNGNYFNGDGVYRKTVARSASRIYGYGRPAYGDSKPYKWDGSAPDGSPILRAGSVGPLVRDMQNALMYLGYDLPQYGDDADFGDETGNALGDFQRDHGLLDDEEYGPKTAKKMRAALKQKRGNQDEEAADDGGQEEDEDDMAKYYSGHLDEGADMVSVSVYAGSITWAGVNASAGQEPVRLRVTASYSDGTASDPQDVTAHPIGTGKKATVKLVAEGKDVDGFSIERLTGVAAVGWDAT